MAGSLEDEFEHPAEAAKTYKSIQSDLAVFELKDDTADPPVRGKKVARKLRPPTAPKPATYAFGPEIA